jgi:polysaccharide deacetylase 2 family uncharacterized protein YibQ
MEPTGADYNNRASQNNYMMSLFLMSSLTEEAIARLHPYRNEYTINNKICAPLLYKVIMRQATIDSKATSEALRQNLNELASYAPTVGGDVDMINSRMEPTGADYNNRASQNNYMMSLFLMSSLTEEAIARLHPYRNEYTINNKICAPLLYKVIMRQATIDSKATSEALRQNLNELASYAPTVGGDVDMINSRFDENYTQLIARGETVDDPIAKLFDAYKNVPCSQFKTYITHVYEDYLDDKLSNFTHEKLMTMATRKFNYLKQKGLWNTTSEEQKYIAMAAELDKLKGELKLSNTLKQAATSSTTDGKDKKKKEKKTKNKKSKKDRWQKKDEEWKKVPPKVGEAKQKCVKEKTYHWCKHHMAWGIHPQAECHFGAKLKEIQARAAVVTTLAVTTPTTNSAYAALYANMA